MTIVACLLLWGAKRRGTDPEKVAQSLPVE